MTDGSSSDTTLSFNTILHMITVKLSPSNYLIWRNQLIPLLAYQKLSYHILGTPPVPPKTIVSTTATPLVPNPAYAKWVEDDQRAFLIIHSSLTETAMAEIIGLATASEVWQRLERSYRHDSHERMQTLRDSLRRLKKGNSSVSEYSSKFRSFCD